MLNLIFAFLADTDWSRYAGLGCGTLSLRLSKWSLITTISKRDLRYTRYFLQLIPFCLLNLCVFLLKLLS